MTDTPSESGLKAATRTEAEMRAARSMRDRVLRIINDAKRTSGSLVELARSEADKNAAIYHNGAHNAAIVLGTSIASMSLFEDEGQ